MKENFRVNKVFLFFQREINIDYKTRLYKTRIKNTFTVFNFLFQKKNFIRNDR